MNEHDANRVQAEFLAAIDRVAALPIDLATFPQEASPEFQAAAADVIHRLARLRFVADGGDLEDLDALEELDSTTVIDMRDLAQTVEGFYDNRDAARYSACRAVLEWAEATGKRD